MRFVFQLLAVALCLATSACSSDIVGRASVIDGDTVDIHGQRIRFLGIDAPESGQRCKKAGQEYRCGKVAAFALADKIGASPIRCKRLDTDRYKRIIAICYLGSLDLNEWMVNEGHAVAYRKYAKDYVGAERWARLYRRVMWAGRFVMPWDWRKGVR